MGERTDDADFVVSGWLTVTRVEPERAATAFTTETMAKAFGLSVDDLKLYQRPKCLEPPSAADFDELVAASGLTVEAVGRVLAVPFSEVGAQLTKERAAMGKDVVKSKRRTPLSRQQLHARIRELEQDLQQQSEWSELCSQQVSRMMARTDRLSALVRGALDHIKQYRDLTSPLVVEGIEARVAVIDREHPVGDPYRFAARPEKHEDDTCQHDQD